MSILPVTLPLVLVTPSPKTVLIMTSVLLILATLPLDVFVLQLFAQPLLTLAWKLSLATLLLVFF